MTIKRAVNTYKTKIRPLARTGNLYHVFPRPDDKVWDGVEYFDPAAKKGAVYGHHLRNAHTTAILRQI